MSEFKRIGSDSQSQADISREEEQIYAGYFANDIETLFFHRNAPQPLQPPYEGLPIPWDRLSPLLNTFFLDVFHDWDSLRALYQTLDLRVAKPSSHHPRSQLPVAVHTPDWKYPQSSEAQLQASRNTELQSTTSSKHQHILPKNAPGIQLHEAAISGMGDQVHSGPSRGKDEVELLPSCCRIPPEIAVNPGYIPVKDDSREGIRFFLQDQPASKRSKFQPDIETDRIRKDGV